MNDQLLRRFGPTILVVLGDITRLASRPGALARPDLGCRRCVVEGALSGSVKVPDAVGPLEVRAELGARQVRTSVSIDAPKVGRPLTRVNWLLRQLKDAPGELRIDTAFVGARETSSEPRLTPLASRSQTRARAFTLTLNRAMGLKRGKAQGSFVAETHRQAFDFYRGLVQDLRPWHASAPKLPESPQVPEASGTAIRVPLSAPGGHDPGGGREESLSQHGTTVY